MKYKTAELDGELLDAAVAKALGVPLRVFTNGMFEAASYDVPFDTGPSESESGDVFEPSTRWAHGGPIIERNFIQIYRNTVRDASGHFHGWVADCPKAVELEPRQKARHGCSGSAAAPLTAAMRAFVATKIGDEVDLP